jgi:hypothetical protein
LFFKVNNRLFSYKCEKDENTASKIPLFFLKSKKNDFPLQKPSSKREFFAKPYFQKRLGV